MTCEVPHTTNIPIEGYDIHSVTSEGVFQALSQEDTSFGELLDKNGYNLLSSEQRNTVLGLLKLDSRNKEYLKNIFESQNNIGIKESLIYILDIILLSKFQYTIRDLYYLTGNSKISWTDREYTLSLQFFAEEKIYKLGYFNIASQEGKYYRPHFFDALIEGRKILGSDNLHLGWFVQFYIDHIEPNSKNILQLRKKIQLSSFFQSIQYLFALGEPWYVWESVNNILLHNKKFNFSKKRFNSLDELDIHLSEEVFSQNTRYKKVWSSLSISQKKSLRVAISGRGKEQLLTDINSVLHDTKMSLEELINFILLTGYSLGDIYNFFNQKIYIDWGHDGEDIGDFLQKNGFSKKEFLERIVRHRIHASQLSFSNIQSILSHGGINDIVILAQIFDRIPDDYYRIRKKINGEFLTRIPGYCMQDIPKFLKILHKLRGILELDPSFSIEYVDWSHTDDVEVKYKSLLSKKQKEQSSSLGIEGYISDTYLYRLESETPEKNQELVLKLKHAGYDVQQAVEFCTQTGYDFQDLESILFYEDSRGWTLEHIPKDRLYHQKIDFYEIVKSGINDRTMRADSLGYYLLLGYPLDFIRRMPFNYAMNNYQMSDDSEVTHEVLIGQIQAIQADFNFNIFSNLLPEYFDYKEGRNVVHQHHDIRLSHNTLQNILQILTIQPHFDFTQLSPYLLYSQKNISYLLTTLVQTNREEKRDYNLLNIRLLEYIIGENIEEFFSIEAKFDIKRDMQGTTREEKKRNMGYYRSQAVGQSLEIANLPIIIEDLLLENGDLPFRDVLVKLLVDQSLFTQEQRYEIIIRAKKYYDSFKQITKYSQKYTNIRDLLIQVNPYKVNYFEVSHEIECQQEGINLTFYFSHEEDYYRCLGMNTLHKESGGVKLGYSKLPGIHGTVCFVNGPIGIENDFTQRVKKHENRHITNGFLFDGTFPETFAKDEIIAYMSDGTGEEELKNILTNPAGLYNYYEALMYHHYGEFEKDWEQYIQRVLRHVTEAYEIHLLYPEVYLNLLAVTPISRWNSILKIAH